MPMIKKPWNWRRPLTKEYVITKDTPTTKPKPIPTTTTTTKPKQTTTTTKQEAWGWSDVGDWIPGGIVPSKTNGLKPPKDKKEWEDIYYQEHNKPTSKATSTANMVAMTRDKQKQGRSKLKKQLKMI